MLLLLNLGEGTCTCKVTMATKDQLLSHHDPSEGNMIPLIFRCKIDKMVEKPSNKVMWLLKVKDSEKLSHDLKSHTDISVGFQDLNRAAHSVHAQLWSSFVTQFMSYWCTLGLSMNILHLII